MMFDKTWVRHGSDFSSHVAPRHGKAALNLSFKGHCVQIVTAPLAEDTTIVYNNKTFSEYSLIYSDILSNAALSVLL